MLTEKKRVAGSWRYVPLSERKLPPEQQTAFVLSPLTGAERERMVDEVNQRAIMPDGSIRVISRMRSIARELFLTKVVSIERFARAWPKSASERETVADLFDDDLVFEVGNEIYDRSALGPETVKPGDPPGDRQIVGESSTPAPTST